MADIQLVACIETLLILLAESDLHVDLGKLVKEMLHLVSCTHMPGDNLAYRTMYMSSFA